MYFRIVFTVVICFLIANPVGVFVAAAQNQNLRPTALAAAKKATKFLTESVSIEGGYLWRYSADLTLKEGEGVVDTRTVWVQPPGTPSVGEAYVDLYEATGDEQFLKAAMEAAEALRQGQMQSGGWQAMVEFEPERRSKWAYRTNDQPSRRAKDHSSLDDDKTQSAMRFVMQLDRALKFRDEKIHEMSVFALDGLIQKGQLPNGGFPQVWTDKKIGHDSDAALAASFPDTWPRKYPGHQEYWHRYTLNDNLASDVAETLFLAEEIYGEAKYRDAALDLADFLLRAQLPAPQPAWAQQYNFQMQPIWARKFEPPAITGGESQDVIMTLLMVYKKTGNRKYLRPIPAALDYFQRSELEDGQLARFYELETNRPLYFTKDYQLTYDDSDVPTHYSFKVRSRVDRLRKEYEKLANLEPDELLKLNSIPPTKPSEKQIEQIVSSQDTRGAWVTNSGMRYHRHPGDVIEMQRAVQNLKTLARFLSGE